MTPRGDRPFATVRHAVATVKSVRSSRAKTVAAKSARTRRAATARTSTATTVRRAATATMRVRPRVFGDKKFGDKKPYTPREGGGEKRPYTPRGEGFRKDGDRPRGDRPYSPRPSRDGDRPERNRPRQEILGGATRRFASRGAPDRGPRKDFGDRPDRGDSKPWQKREDRGERDSRPPATARAISTSRASTSRATIAAATSVRASRVRARIAPRDRAIVRNSTGPRQRPGKAAPTGRSIRAARRRDERPRRENEDDSRIFAKASGVRRPRRLPRAQDPTSRSARPQPQGKHPHSDRHSYGDRPHYDRPRQEHPRSEAASSDRPRRDNEDDSKIFAKRPAFGGRGAYRERTPDFDKRAPRRRAKRKPASASPRWCRAPGLASRRDAEEWITQGRVTVNGRVINSPALDVTANDVITVDGKPLPPRERTRLFMFTSRAA